jgi:hypothetical protein
VRKPEHELLANFFDVAAKIVGSKSSETVSAYFNSGKTAVKDGPAARSALLSQIMKCQLLRY